MAGTLQKTDQGNVMKKQTDYILFLLFILFFWLTAWNAEADNKSSHGLIRGQSINTGNEIRQEIKIVSNIKIKKEADGDHIRLREFIPGGAPGHPELPFVKFGYLLPENVNLETVSISLEDSVWETVHGEYHISPVRPPATTSTHTRLTSWDHLLNGKDMEIYEKDTYFPEQKMPLGQLEISKYRQWNLAYLSLFPVLYNPYQKSILLLRSGTIHIRFTEKSAATTFFPKKMPPVRSKKYWLNISSKIENPQMHDSFYLSMPFEKSDQDTNETGDAKGNGNPNFLIITTEDIQTNSKKLESFIKHKEYSGYTVKIVTENSSPDDSHYESGSSAQARAENIRSYLRENNRYLDWGIEYVLLIGNPHPGSFNTTSSIPMMMCYPSYISPTDFFDCPTDMYFAELSGNWDLDGDGVIGEYGDDFGVGGIDRDCEIAVGRIPYYGSVEDLDRILQKIITYETTFDSNNWRKKLLIPAAISNHSPEDHNGDGDTVDNGEYSNQASRTFGDDWGDALKLLVSTSTNVYSLYEKEGVYTNGTAFPLAVCNAGLTLANVQSEWQGHYGFVTWWGHGNGPGVYRRVWDNDSFSQPGGAISFDNITQHSQETQEPAFWESASCSTLNDAYPSIVILIACTNGLPEIPNNLGYSLLKNGAVATVSATRVSWYASGSWFASFGSSHGDNASYAYHMIDLMINSRMKIGDALNHCKRSFGMGFAAASWMNCLDFNIYGDPSTNQEITKAIYVDGGWTGTENGTYEYPFNTVSEGMNAVISPQHSGNYLFIRSGSYTGAGNVPLTVDKNVVFLTYEGTTVIGQ